MNKLKALQTWETRMRDMNDALGLLHDATGFDDSAPINKAVFALQGAYTAAIAERVGLNEEWLDEWWNGRNFGERALEVTVNGVDYVIKTTAELHEVLVDIED